jgi:uncharacterized protein YndB with AHSA1/START domain
MNKPKAVHVIVIAASPEEVWEGLTSPEFTQQYWHRTKVDSDFEVGSPVRFYVDSGDVACEGEILTSDYPTYLAYTWQFPLNPETKDEAPSRVTFRLEEVTGGTRLTVVHDRFPDGSKMLEMVDQGWPAVLSGLKTLLESGQAVDFTADD